MSLFDKEYTGDSDSDAYVMGENDDFDAAVNEDAKNAKEESIENDDSSPKENDELALPKGTSVKREQNGDALSKKKQRFAELKKRRKERNEQNRLTFDTSKMSLIEQSAYFWSYILLENKDKQFDSQGIEYPFEEQYIQEMKQPHDDSSFLQQIKDVVPNWKQQLVKRKGIEMKSGSPSVLVLCISAIRCTELLKPLSDLGIYIPKLFGKHIKIEDQKKALSKVTPIAIGVPNRVLRLVEEGILDLSNVSLVIIDMKENEKTMNVMSLKETRDAMVKLYMNYLHNAVIHNTAKVSFW